MTAQALAGVLAGLSVALLALAVLLERRRRAVELALWVANRDAAEAADGLQAAEVRNAELGADLRHAQDAQRAADDRADELTRRLIDLEAERSSSPLEGELVIVNTPKPDDQTLRGVCRLDLGRERGLVLASPEYVDTTLERGSEQPRRVPLSGDVHVPAYSFVQIVQRTEES